MLEKAGVTWESVHVSSSLRKKSTQRKSFGTTTIPEVSTHLLVLFHQFPLQTRHSTNKLSDLGFIGQIAIQNVFQLVVQLGKVVL